MNMTAARALYTGIVTDTGRFRYRSVTVRHVQGRRPSAWITVSTSRTVLMTLDVKTENLMRLQGYVLQNFQKTPNGVAYIETASGHRSKISACRSKKRPRSSTNWPVFEDCPVWMLFAEYEGDIVRADCVRKDRPSILLANQFWRRRSSDGVRRRTSARWDQVSRFIEAQPTYLVGNYKASLNSPNEFSGFSFMKTFF
ncbi:MAG: hypothetical protein MZU97_21810 [Bacillus subtilis]|nr:hypothetical protein [Bacillus subtilis]